MNALKRASRKCIAESQQKSAQGEKNSAHVEERDDGLEDANEDTRERGSRCLIKFSSVSTSSLTSTQQNLRITIESTSSEDSTQQFGYLALEANNASETKKTKRSKFL